MNLQIEKLLARVMVALTKTLKNQLILKGGMQLRLLNSPRATQDIDFVLLSEESKKKLAPKITEALGKLDGIRITDTDLNSRGIFIEVRGEDESMALIEVNVAKSTHLKPEPVSSAALTSRHSMETVLVTALALPEAFSHKIAAAIERRTLRDLYDLSFYESMGPFDVETLKDRLSRLCLNRAKPRYMDYKEAAGALRKRAEALMEEDLKKELYPLLPPELRGGQLRVIQASMSRLAQRLEALD